ncbi:MAG: hypothetical protein ACI90U_001864 [Pseudomonadales bacterium]|jgi:hypothetical protein
MKKLISLITISSALLLCISCSSSTITEAENKQERDPRFTQCEDPRPEICTREYNPVCAIKAIAVQCVTTPCPSTEEITYATGCTACADSKVTEYKQGACE